VNLISLEKAAKAYAHRSLLDNVSLGVSAGDRIGVVGRNGAGKSTLLGLLAGRVEPDTGRVAMATGLRLGYLPQDNQLSGTVGEVVFGREVGSLSTPWEADPRARTIMAELLPGIGVDAAADRLSGGERRRVALASLLVAECDVLLLDEPTNHLDIEAIDWLGRHLRDRGCAVIVVSHDRWLLDTVCDRTWEVDRGNVHSAEGGYSAYVLAQAERERSEEATERRRRNLARKELAWLQRGAKARTTKAKFRVEAATALIASEPPPRDSVELTRLATARLGKTVVELEDLSVSVGTPDDSVGTPDDSVGTPDDQRTLLDHITWRLGPGDRIGVVGVNGSGKTSLLNVVADTGSGRSGVRVEGTVIRGKTVRLAYLSQELAELDPELRVREAVEEIRLRIRVGDRELSAGQLLERLGFTAERQWTKIGDLSGGERRRVQMLRLLMDEPNVLLLDEPTNDLDIETLTEFEDLLDDWPGTLVVVSHDRYFLERVTEHVVALVGDRKLAFLAGGVDEYLDRVRAVRAASGGTRAASGGTRAASGGARAASGGTRDVSGGARAVSEAGRSVSGAGLAAGTPASVASKASAAEDRAARKELQRLERQLERLSTRETELGVQLAANASDYEKLTALGAELRSTQTEKADLEERWLTVAAQLDA
jgi:ABC transport system ATP-binding/permease protein